MKTDSFLNNNETWIMYNCENNDPYFTKFITSKTVAPAVSIMGNNKSFLIVSQLDCDNVKTFEGDVLVYDNENSLIKNIDNALKILNYPQTIYLNYSDKLDAYTDVLGYGTYRFLRDNILKIYSSFSKSNPDFKSADKIIYHLMDKKSEEDIKYLEIAANRALEILNIAFNKIKSGLTEKQIAGVVHNIFKVKPRYYQKYGIVKEELSWERELCPIVLVGPNFTKGGHSAPSNTIFKKGQTIYFDFGVKIFLKNGRKYSSDIQRMGYALKNNETCAPEYVQKIFNTLYKAVSLGIQNCTPMAKGEDIDKIVRDYIKNAGYPDYNHATGHPIGESSHAPGTSISPKGHKRSNLYLQENGVYTIEPRMAIENGGSIEEMIRVTKSGGVTLCPPQKSLYLIR